MQYFNFSRLINKYMTDFTAITFSEGYYNDSGDFVKGEKTETTLQGAIINYKESTVRRSEGTLTAQDKRLFMLKPLEQALKGAKVIHDGKTYSIEDCGENAMFSGVYAYTLKYCSAFKGD